MHILQNSNEEDLKEIRISSCQSLINSSDIDPTTDFYYNDGCTLPPMSSFDDLDESNFDDNDEAKSNKHLNENDSQESTSSAEHLTVRPTVTGGLTNMEKLETNPPQQDSSSSHFNDLTTSDLYQTTDLASERVKVVIRCRPMNEKESKNRCDNVVNVHPETHQVEVFKPKNMRQTGSRGEMINKIQSKTFTFDAVYDSRPLNWIGESSRNEIQSTEAIIKDDVYSSQKEIYEESFSSLVNSVLEGYNGTIFAYGQTGTGKTYTMEGIRGMESEQGVIPNAFEQIFDAMLKDEKKEYLIRVSYLEIYQEVIRDLLSSGKKLREGKELKESPDLGVYVKDLSTYLCSNFNEINELMTKGNKNRSVGATNMNEHSSRSHAILMITIEMSETFEDESVHFKAGKLNLVDLAGSERQGKTGAAGERLKEATKINLSLSALGNVIGALADEKSTHVPYRDSKLTRLLQDSLGGNSRTVMVATIGPADFNYEETMTTLRYASRAKKIRNKPVINEDPKDAMLRQYQEEIQRLRQLLEGKKHEKIASYPALKSDMKDEDGIDMDKKDVDGNNGLSSRESESLDGLTQALQSVGLDPSIDKKDLMDKLDEKRAALLNDSTMVKAKKEKLLSKIDATKAHIGSTQEECEKLKNKIDWLESKLVCRGKSLMDHTEEQRRLLEMKQQELAEQIASYEETRRKMEENEMTTSELKNTLHIIQEDLETKSKKMNKMTHKNSKLLEQTKELEGKYSTRIQEVQLIFEEVQKELSLKKVIEDNFVPEGSVMMMTQRMEWNEADETYHVKPIKESLLLNCPQLERNDRIDDWYLESNDEEREEDCLINYYRSENILRLSPIRSEHSSKKYVPPSLDPYIASLLARAFEDAQRDVSLDCSTIRSKRIQTAQLSQEPTSLKIGSNFIRRVKSARPSSFDHSSCSFQDFTSVSASLILPQKRKNVGKFHQAWS